MLGCLTQTSSFCAWLEKRESSPEFVADQIKKLFSTMKMKVLVHLQVNPGVLHQRCKHRWSSKMSGKRKHSKIFLKSCWFVMPIMTRQFSPFGLFLVHFMQSKKNFKDFPGGLVSTPNWVKLQIFFGLPLPSWTDSAGASRWEKHP